MATIALFGATGRTGRHTLDELIAAGHTVRVISRRPEAIPAHDGVTMIVGDFLDATAVSGTVDGADAVISVFGHVKGSPPRLQTDGTPQVFHDAIAHLQVLRASGLDWTVVRGPRPTEAAAGSYRVGWVGVGRGGREHTQIARADLAPFIVAQLAHRLSVTSGAVSQTIDGLVEASLVTSEVNLADRRGRVIRLTDEARSEVAVFEEGYFDAVAPGSMR